jgi:Xaa-Pro aminopeptidase
MASEDQKPKDDVRARTPHSQKFLDYIASGWAENKAGAVDQAAVAPYAAARRQKLAQAFAGKVIAIHAGSMQVRSNDTDFRYRPHSAFSHLTGWGSAAVADSILVVDARSTETHSVLYFRESAGRDSDEFFANPAIGEFWVGARPGLESVSQLLGLETRSLSKFDGDFEKELAGGNLLNLETAEVAEFLSELRLVKDSFEIEQMRQAVAATELGFKEIRANLDKAQTIERGERVVETAFFSAARLHGNDLGYDTIAAAGAHACTLHWIQNDGPVRSGELILVDAGVEIDSLYTADITRTLPINGKFTEVQKKIYEAVLEAADAVFAIAKPGIKFHELHDAAMKVIARKTAEWGLLPVTADESLEKENQHHRRWMVHGTSHHLGLDVHDCAQARRDLYQDGVLEPGMVFTIEPGLYFHPDDLLVPEQFRGIGVRIEDDVLVTETGVENLSVGLPRTVADIERWMVG